VPAYSCTPGLPPVGTFSTVCVSLAKLQANQKSADFLKQEAHFYKPPINVTFAKLPNNLNHVGVEQLPCNHCGDCVWGCNNKAKNTTAITVRRFSARPRCAIWSVTATAGSCASSTWTAPRDGMYGRCIGHGAIPYGVTSELKGNTQVQWSETLSADDPNYPLRVRNGYVKVRLDGPQISETFIGETGAVSWSRPRRPCSRCRAREAATRSAGPCLTVFRRTSGALKIAAPAASECRPSRSQPCAAATDSRYWW